MAYKYGIYEWVDEAGDVIYIGSTSKWTLSGLEENHRMWREKWGPSGATWFRESLVEKGENWIVRWAQEPKECPKEQIEIEEGALIRYCKPLYNKDMNPYESSVDRGRYKGIVH
tara:strand:- start:3372 stop:3713 length:342 start_codon:yes stop_codon:yes gene_type:complete